MLHRLLLRSGSVSSVLFAYVFVGPATSLPSTGISVSDTSTLAARRSRRRTRSPAISPGRSPVYAAKRTRKAYCGPGRRAMTVPEAMMCRLHRNAERRTDVFPPHPIEIASQRDVLARQPLHYLTELKRQHRDVEMPRDLNGPVRFTPGRGRIAHPRQPQLACHIQQRPPSRLERRLGKLRLLRRTTGTARHRRRLPDGSVSI
jgi:hypothetical protein